MPIKRWKIGRPDRAAVEQLEKGLGLPKLVAQVLASRGYDTPEKVSRFLAQEQGLSDPMSLKDMEKAAARVRQALEAGERIAIYGDYDCDGIMSTVLLYSYLEALGGEVCYYIPERDREGYGLNRAALELIRREGVSLVITVDNGITAIEFYPNVATSRAMPATIRIRLIETQRFKKKGRRQMPPALLSCCPL